MGNKSDCNEKFDQTEVEQFCAEKKIQYHQVSAKTGNEVGQTFNDLAEKLTKIHPKIEKKETTGNAVVSNIMKKKN